MSPRQAARWRLLSSHARLLLAIAGQSDLTVRELAARVEVTERTAYALLRDLEAVGFVSRTRVAGRARIAIEPAARSRDPLLAGCTIGELLAALERLGAR